MSVWDSISNAYHSAEHAVTDTAHSAEASVSSWLGHGADTSGPATAHGGDGLNHAGDPTSLWGRIGQGVGDFGRGISQEGLGAVLDPTGAVDRQRAQRELSTRFQVLPDDFVGPRQSNQVTQAEYQRIARTFSNIRTGRGDLTMNGSSFDNATDRHNWEQGIQSNLADMMMTDGGRNQIYSMSNNVTRKDDGTARRHLWGLGPEVHHQTDIAPLFGVAHGTNPDGTVHWDDPGRGHHDASTMRYDNAFAAQHDDVAQQRDRATYARGEGSDSTLHINPGHILGLRTDVVLAHEMQHARNQTQGTNAPYGSKFGSGADTNVENRERQAVGLTRSDTPNGGHYPGDPDGCTENTYRAERNALGDRFLPRTAYTTLPGEAPVGPAGDAQLQNAWNTYNTSGQAAPPAPEVVK